MECIFAKQPASASAEDPVSPKERPLQITSGRRSNASLQKLENVQASSGVGEGKEVTKVRSKRNADFAADVAEPARGRRREKPNPRLSNPPKHVHGEQVAAGVPAWLSAVAGEVIKGWIPHRADTFEKLDKKMLVYQQFK